MAKFKLLPLCSLLLAILHWCDSQECMYEYTSHPMVNLTCDPYGSNLKLHCAVTGPLHPHFLIQWYLFPGDDPEQNVALGTSDDDYHVDSDVLNVVGDVDYPLRSISSVLTTGPIRPIADTLQNHCIKCQVEFQDVGITLGSEDSSFCLSSKASYGPLESCSDSYVVQNSTSVCASPQGFTVLNAGPESLPRAGFQLPSPSASSSLLPSLFQPVTASLENMEPTSSHLVQSSSLHHPGASTVTNPLPFKSVSLSGTSNSTLPNNTTSANSSQAAVQKGLFVAIGVCVLFIVIIIILMYFVVRLCRQWWWRRKDKLPDDNEDANDGDTSASSNPTAALARGYSVEHFQMDSETLFLPHLGEDTILTTRSLQDLTQIQVVPPVPPRPWRKANSASAINWRGLTRGYNNFTFPGDRIDGQFGAEDIPPPIPLRSKSRDHFYHTLEYPENDDSGVASVSSPRCSQQRSSNSSQGQAEDALASLPPQRSSSSHAEDVFIHRRSSNNSDSSKGQNQQTQQLFDDPRYAALRVEGCNLKERKEIWRSTPALASTHFVGGGGGRERRSLRLTHIVGTDIYD